jgi:hypothetical protein
MVLTSPQAAVHTVHNRSEPCIDAAVNVEAALRDEFDIVILGSE